MASIPEEGHALRRAPSQDRSRARVEKMLAAATALIAEQGSDAMRMGDVAARAGVSIGSLYQYFPDKGAIIRTLAERYNAEGQACIATELASVRDARQLSVAFAKLVDIYYGLFLAEPVMRDVWSGMQADKALRDVDLAASRANGTVLAGVLQKLRPREDPDALATEALLVMYLGEATMRLAVSLERREGDALVEAYKRMSLRTLAGDAAAVARPRKRSGIARRRRE